MFSDFSFYHFNTNYSKFQDKENSKSLILEYARRNAILARADLDAALLPLDSDFFLDGEVDYLFSLPMTGEMKQHLLYLQNFSIMKMGSSYYTRRKSSPFYLVLYTLDGKGSLEYEGKKYTLLPGDGFFIDCRKPHYYYADCSHWNHIDLVINGGATASLYQEYRYDHSAFFHIPVADVILNRVEQILLHHTTIQIHRERFISHEIESLLIYLLQLDSTTNEVSAISENIIFLRTYMEQHFTESLTMDSLSHFCGSSKYHMSREFKRYTGFSPLEYLNELRIEYAKELLVNTSYPAYKIGKLSGIPNEANFIRLFKDRVHCTPGHYRKQT